MKAGIIYTGTGPILILTSYQSFRDPKLIEKLGAKGIKKFIAREISPHSYVNIMDQYHPEYRAGAYPEINRRITHKEYLAAVQAAKHMGLYRGF